MNKALLALLICLFLFGCSSEPNENPSTTLTGIEALELSFGDNASLLPEEYLLVRPGDLVVNNKHDVIILDEEKIKIFDKHGEPKFITGGKGQGPGEFFRARKPKISSDGYLTVLDHTYGVNLYSPGIEFIKKESFRAGDLHRRVSEEHNLENPILLECLYVDKIIRVVCMNGYDKLSTDFEQTILFGIDRGYSFIQLARLPRENVHLIPLSFETRTIRVQFDLDFLGQFLWDYSPEGKIIYTNTGAEILSEKKAEYTINILTLNDGSESSISHEFERTPVQSAQIEYALRHPQAERMEDGLKGLKNIIAKKKYNASLQKLLTDRNYIFAFTYKINNNKEIFTDVFDINTREHISSAYFLGIPSFIKGGFAYYLKLGSEDEFPRVDKYKIASALFK